MAKARPDLFYAFVGTGQLADPATSYTVAYRELLRKAERLKDERAVRELREVRPPAYPDGRGYRVQRKWSNYFEGADAFIFSMVGFALAAPGYTLRDVNDWFDGSECQWRASGSANERARRANARRRLRCSGFRDSGR